MIKNSIITLLVRGLVLVALFTMGLSQYLLEQLDTDQEETNE